MTCKNLFLVFNNKSIIIKKNNLAHFTDVNKNKYLMFAELKNIGLTKGIFDKFC